MIHDLPHCRSLSHALECLFGECNVGTRGHRDAAAAYPVKFLLQVTVKTLLGTPFLIQSFLVALIGTMGVAGNTSLPLFGGFAFDRRLIRFHCKDGSFEA